MPYNKWMPLQTQLDQSGIKLTSVDTNLIDLLWPDRPARPKNKIAPLPLKYTGKSAIEKLEAVRKTMTSKNASLLVITALDEIAWVLNLRGSDIQYNPVFFSYLIIYPNSFTLFLDEKQMSPEIEQHLTDELGKLQYKIEPYDKIKTVLKSSLENLEGMAWFSESANYALTSLAPTKSLLAEISPLALMKVVKNDVEIEGIKFAHKKDAVALCSYFHWLEKNIKNETITELSGAQKLLEFRQEQVDFVGPSFETINGFGPHGAIIHYRPVTETDAQITNDALYLCDSGGQYKDGTTDITRTMHFGNPTDYEREAFTRVLKGQIAIATMVFPTKIKGNSIDAFARKFLWDVGLDYGHGTGHGIGFYLNVHEGPIGVSYKNSPDDPGLEAGMFLSNEPGFYEDGKFGIRIEDIVLTVPANTPHNFNNRGFLKFETVSLAPIQTKMIIAEMLTKKEIDYVNTYHKKVRDLIGPLLEKQGKNDVKNWLWKQTELISASAEIELN